MVGGVEADVDVGESALVGVDDGRTAEVVTPTVAVVLSAEELLVDWARAVHPPVKIKIPRPAATIDRRAPPGASIHQSCHAVDVLVLAWPPRASAEHP